MLLPGDMNLQGLALLGNVPPGAEGGPPIATRMFDTDGDGRPDLFLVDLDNDGTIDGAVRGFDTDGDGLADTFVQYDEEGNMTAVGRLDPETREFEVSYADDEGFDDDFSSLDLSGFEPLDGAVFTTFDDPVIGETFGSFGDDVPGDFEAGEVVGLSGVDEVDENDLESMDPGADIVSDSAAGGKGEPGSDDETAVAEVTPRVVEIEDRSGAADGSDLYAKVDTDGDALADSEERLSRTSDGTWHGDIDKDGYSDEVAFDRDLDGRIESVDTTGRGSSTDTVGAESVASPESDQIVDRQPGEDDFTVEEDRAAADAGMAAADDSVSDGFAVEDAGAAGVAAEDAGFGDSPDVSDGFSASDAGDAGDSGTLDDSGGSYDAGSSYDSGTGDVGGSTDSDIGSTTIDSGSDSGSGDID